MTLGTAPAEVSYASTVSAEARDDANDQDSNLVGRKGKATCRIRTVAPGPSDDILQGGTDDESSDDESSDSDDEVCRDFAHIVATARYFASVSAGRRVPHQQQRHLTSRQVRHRQKIAMLPSQHQVSHQQQRHLTPRQVRHRKQRAWFPRQRQKPHQQQRLLT